MRVGGSGPPLVYLHAAGGPIWDPFIEWLTESFTVYAPHHPGTGETARDAIYEVESLWDLVLIYDEIFDALNLRSVPVVGTSFGGMMACEMAAHRPDRVSKLILLDPIGLWREDMPVAPYMLMPPEKLVATLYKDLSSEPVQKALQMPDDPDQVATIIADLVWALGATGKFVWPIPDKGLKKRIHRIKAETLIVWGEDDALGVFGLREGIRRTDRQFAGRNHQGLRARSAGRAARSSQAHRGEISPDPAGRRGGLSEECRYVVK